MPDSDAQLFYTECSCALASCICSLLNVISFAKSTHEQEIKHNDQEPPERKFEVFGLFNRPMLPTFSTGVLFIAISILLRSIANLFSLLQLFPAPLTNMTLCNYEGMLRTYAILMNFAALLVLSLQLYTKLVPDTMNVLKIEGIFVTYLRKTLFREERGEDHKELRESQRDFHTALYHFIAFYPLIIAMLPWAADGYGVNRNGLQHCTFSKDFYGRLWAWISLYLTMLVLWLLMILLFLVTYWRINASLAPVQRTLFTTMTLFVVISMFVWVPLMIGIVVPKAARFWEVVIQLDGVFYFTLYVYLQWGFRKYDEQQKFRTSVSRQRPSLGASTFRRSGGTTLQQDAKLAAAASDKNADGQPGGGEIDTNPLHLPNQSRPKVKVIELTDEEEQQQGDLL